MDMNVHDVLSMYVHDHVRKWPCTNILFFSPLSFTHKHLHITEVCLLLQHVQRPCCQLYPHASYLNMSNVLADQSIPGLLPNNMSNCPTSILHVLEMQENCDMQNFAKLFMTKIREILGMKSQNTAVLRRISEIQNSAELSAIWHQKTEWTEFIKTFRIPYR